MAALNTPITAEGHAVAPLRSRADAVDAINDILLARERVRVYRELLHDVAQEAMEAVRVELWSRYIAIDHAMGESLEIIRVCGENLELSKPAPTAMR